MRCECVRRRASSRPPAPRVFLLSPANAGGERAALLLRPAASFPLAVQLRSPEGASLGDVFTFASGLYFRGKRTYAQAFGRAPHPCPSCLVITAGAGLLPLGTRVTAESLRLLAQIPIDGREPRYREPLVRDAARLDEALGGRGEVVLLGSIATGKYTAPLLEVFGDRLLFPSAFVGRGDMSRGGLLLRAVRAGVELDYEPVRGAVRRGPRPPKLSSRKQAAERIGRRPTDRSPVR